MVIFIRTGYAQSRSFKDTLQIKSNFLKAPDSETKSLTKLAAYLTENETSDTQKALNIYTWITNNIRYDYKLYEKGRIKKFYEPKQTVRKRKGLCYQYSELFSKLCHYAGIRSLVVYGYAKQGKYDEEHTYYQGDHAWNAVRLEGKWLLTDLTYGSGHQMPRKQWLKTRINKILKRKSIPDAYKFQKAVNYEYFLLPPEKMIIDHFPEDPVFQLLQFPVSLSTFENSGLAPYVDRIDTVYNKTVSLEESYKTLDQYTRFSVIQYVSKVAEAAYTYNPLNTVLLAETELNRVPDAKRLSGYASSVRGNNEMIKILSGAIKYAKKQKKVIRTENSQTRKKLLIRFKNELEVPVKDREKLAGNYHTRYARGINQFIRYSNRYASDHSSYRKASADSYALPKQIRRSKYKKPSLVAKNLTRISEVISRSDSLICLQDSMLLMLEQMIAPVAGSAEGAGDLYLKLLRQTDSNTILISNGVTLDTVSASWNHIKYLGALSDSIERELQGQIDTVQKLYRSVRDVNRSLRADARQAMDLIAVNCKVGEGRDCDRIGFDHLGDLVSLTYSNQAELLRIAKSYESNLGAVYKMNYDLTAAHKKLLIENSEYIQLLKALYLKRLIKRQARHLIVVNGLIKKSNARIDKLRNINRKLRKG